jgi:aminopeptidase N
MRDRVATLMGLLNTGSTSAEKPLHKFYLDFKNEAWVIDKWFSLQAVAAATEVKTVRMLMKHPAFILKNPNCARSLYLVFATATRQTFSRRWKWLCLLG